VAGEDLGDYLKSIAQRYRSFAFCILTFELKGYPLVSTGIRDAVEYNLTRVPARMAVVNNH
jgi:hypothetical protein